MKTRKLVFYIVSIGIPGGVKKVKNPRAMRETWVRSQGQEDPLEKRMTTHSSVLAWRTPCSGEPGGLQSTGSQRAGHNSATKTHHVNN